ncbi:Glutathione S-transferase [Quillaja saponaria]|uniref:glutathione transferase n=1 Tax=Quillaja saponaria TaxID=32244 RepID=A0AAD7LQ87_QUISA|nr:Glutathione S-transferase [Quillaja saponaria]
MSSKTTLNSPIKESSSSINSSSSASKLVLYSFWQSSCSWRVRFALNLKGLLYEYKAVNLTKGEHYGPEFERLNPLHYVPVVVDDDIVLSDSYAILLYLEEKYTQKPLLPVNPWLRALNLQVASIINSSIQPLHMMAILMYMEKKLGIREPQLFAQSAIEKGLYALERLLKDVASTYATGEEVYMADVFLAPQIAVASTRFSIDMSKFPTLSRIYESYKALPEFQASSPESQPDACNTPMPQHHRLIESVTGAPVPNK